MNIAKYCPLLWTFLLKDAQAPDGGKYGRKLQTLRSRREGARVTFARKSVSAELDPPVDKGLIFINGVVTWRGKKLRKIGVGVVAISDSHEHRPLQIAAVTVVKKVALYLSLTIRRNDGGVDRSLFASMVQEAELASVKVRPA